jgi:hypothetical protein
MSLDVPGDADVAGIVSSHGPVYVLPRREVVHGEALVAIFAIFPDVLYVGNACPFGSNPSEADHAGVGVDYIWLKLFHKPHHPVNGPDVDDRAADGLRPVGPPVGTGAAVWPDAQFEGDAVGGMAFLSELVVEACRVGHKEEKCDSLLHKPVNQSHNGFRSTIVDLCGM